MEYFGGFVAAGWVAHAGSDASGVAAEPCAPSAGERWLLPDASTLENDQAFVVVMNPFAATAVFSLTVYTDKSEPIRTEDWTDVGAEAVPRAGVPTQREGARVRLRVDRGGRLGRQDRGVLARPHDDGWDPFEPRIPRDGHP